MNRRRHPKVEEKQVPVLSDGQIDDLLSHYRGSA